MDVKIKGATAFSHLQVQLDPGETMTTESGAMASMELGIELHSQVKGGFFAALMRRLFAGESFFINTFRNVTDISKELFLSKSTPGDIQCITLTNDSFFLQPGAFICCTPGLQIKTKWAGFASFFSGEGLFRLYVHGTGKVWFGCYGSIIQKQLQGEYLVDTGHLVAYEPSVKLKLQLSGGLFSSFFSGEGLVARLEGQGTIYIQTRSLGGLVGWLNPRIR